MDRESDMTEEFSLDQKKTTILVAVFLLLFFLVFIAGYLSGTLVGLPEPAGQPVVKAPVIKPQPKPAVLPMQVPQVETESEPEEDVDIEEDTQVERLYAVQVGSFKTRDRADDQVQQLIEKGYTPYIYHGSNSKGVLWHTVRIADFATVEEAVAFARRFKAKEGSAVVLTHVNALLLVKDADGKKIEIAPLADTEEDLRASGSDGVAGESEIDSTEEESEMQAAEGDEVETDTEVETERPYEKTTAEAVVPGQETAASSKEDPAIMAAGNGAETKAVADDGQADDSQQDIGNFHAAESGDTTDFALPLKVIEPEKAADDREPEDLQGLIATTEANLYSVQVGAFLKKDNAYRFAEKLKGRGYPAYVFHYTDTAGNSWNAVRAGDFQNLETAKDAAAAFQEKEDVTAIVTRIDAIKMIMAH